MMFAALPPYDPPAIIIPADPSSTVIQIKKRRNRDGNTQNQNQTYDTQVRREGWPNWMYVGAVILLTDQDGNEKLCTLVDADIPASNYWCEEDGY
jgi:hypothetical protein